jgi:hypothetical protein
MLSTGGCQCRRRRLSIREPTRPKCRSRSRLDRPINRAAGAVPARSRRRASGAYRTVRCRRSCGSRLVDSTHGGTDPFVNGAWAAAVPFHLWRRRCVAAGDRTVNEVKKKFAFWNSTSLLLLAVVGLFWWVNANLRPHGAKNPDELGTFTPPPTTTPRPSPAARLHNGDAGRLVDLDGLAILYPDVVDRLVRADGWFRTELALDEIAKELDVPPAKLALRGSTTRIDPDAVLFRVALGRLTEHSRAVSRERRAIEARIRSGFATDIYEWVTSERSFTIRSLTNPSSEEKAILDAISRAVHGVPAPRGVKIKAVGIWRVPEPDLAPSVFTGGSLPREEPAGE